MAGAQLADEIAEGRDLQRIEAMGGLVEEEDGRIVEERRREADALAEALRALADALVHDVRQAAALDDEGAALAPELTIETAYARDELEERGDAHGFEEGVVLGQVADLPSDPPRLPLRVVPADEDAALVRSEVGREHAQERRLARAVGAEQADDLAGLDSEADGVDGDVGAVAPGDALGADHPYRAAEPAPSFTNSRARLPTGRTRRCTRRPYPRGRRARR